MNETRISGSHITANHISIPSVKLGWPQTGPAYGGYQAVGPWRESLEVEDEQVVWKVEMPDTAKEYITLFQLGEQLIIRAPYAPDNNMSRCRPAETRLDLPEQVKFGEIKLELGVLRVVLERPNKKVVLEIQ